MTAQHVAGIARVIVSDKGIAEWLREHTGDTRWTERRVKYERALPGDACPGKRVRGRVEAREASLLAWLRRRSESAA